MSQYWNWELAQQALPRLMEGFLITLQATVLGSILAMTLGLAIALLRRVSPWPVRVPLGWTVEFIRSTPLLIQLYVLYIVFPEFGITMSAMTVGILGLGIHYSTYTSEVYRAGIEAVPVGQWEAATALSLPARRTWQVVILPQALRSVLPNLGNYVIAMFKDTPYLLAVSVTEMVYEARDFGQENFSYIESFTIAGLIFLAASYPASLLTRRLEKHFAHR